MRYNVRRVERGAGKSDYDDEILNIWAPDFANHLKNRHLFAWRSHCILSLDTLGRVKTPLRDILRFGFLDTRSWLKSRHLHFESLFL